MEQASPLSQPQPARVQFNEQALTKLRAVPLLLAVITFSLGLIYLAVVPPWGGPDEPRHFEYVRLLSDKGRFIGYPDIEQSVMDEIIRSMDAVNYWNWGVTLWERASPGELPKDFTAIYGEGAHQLHQPPLAYLLYLVPHKLFEAGGLRAQLYGMRFLSILLNVVTVLAAYYAGKELFRRDDSVDDPTIALAIPVFVMLLPQHLFLHSTVMNDHLVVAALGWMLAVMVQTFRRGLSLLRVLAMLVLLGIALAAKRNGLYGIPILAFAFLVYMVAHWGSGRLTTGQRAVRLAGAAVAILVLIAGLAAAWNWTTVNVPKLSEYIVLLFLMLPTEQFPTTVDARYIAPETLRIYAQSLRRIFITFWGHFGWSNITLGVQVYWGFTALCVAAIVGLGLYALRDFRKLITYQRAVLVVFAASVVVAVGMMLVFDARGLDLGWEPGSVGRYLFPVLIPLATLFLLGTRAFFPRPRFMLWFGIVTAAMVLYNVIVLGFFIIPFYRA
jgi:4-amino-4-deoxy-L-arabinose transferase-like glycosyltransferase